MIEIARKINLTRTLDIMANLFPEEYDFHPQSWFLPQQYAEFADVSRRLIVSVGQTSLLLIEFSTQAELANLANLPNFHA